MPYLAIQGAQAVSLAVNHPDLMQFSTGAYYVCIAWMENSSEVIARCLFHLPKPTPLHQ